MDEKNNRAGIMYGLGAYLLWGILPIYWKLLHHVGAMEILASRFIWSAFFVLLIIVLAGKWQQFKGETREIFSSWNTGVRLVLAAIVISFNWGIFIWAVEAGRIVETSMGYYITPLVNVLFGVLFLHERLGRMQIIAVGCAALGILYMIIQNGSLPLVSLSMPATFSTYGLLKKLIKAEALTTIMLETLIISPLAIGYLYYLGTTGSNIYQSADTMTLLLLVGAGIVTATPMLLFTAATRRLPLYLVGFMQYIAPSISLLIGVFMYGEVFSSTYAVSFSCIWLGLAFFTWGQLHNN